AASRSAFFKSSSPARVFALTGTIRACSRNDPRKYSSASSRTSSSVSLSTRSLFVNATTPRCTPSNRQISKCSRVCGLMDSSAAITSSSTSIPAAPASMLLTKRSCPGTSTKPKRTPFSSRKAKPKSMVMPRRFSSSRRSGCVPVRASTNADFPSRCFARLIIGCLLHFGIFRAHARSDDQKALAARLANGFGFLNRCDHAVCAGFFAQQRQLDHARLRRAAHSDFLHGFVVHAGENRDRQQTRPVRAHGHAGADGLRRRLHHGFAAERMDIQQLHAGHACCGKYGARNGIRNVMV